MIKWLKNLFSFDKELDIDLTESDSPEIGVTVDNMRTIYAREAE